MIIGLLVALVVVMALTEFGKDSNPMDAREVQATIDAEDFPHLRNE